jgi:hypothetical protein
MKKIDLTSFGFPGRSFEYHGQIKAQRQSGDRLLFLFNESHRNDQMICLNLKNACTLWDLGVLSCAGVEEYPYYFMGWDEAAIVSKSKEQFNAYRDDEGVIKQCRQTDQTSGHLRFGRSLSLLRPQVAIRSVEDLDLCAMMKLIADYRGQVASRLPSDAPAGAHDLWERDYVECRTNLARDDAFLRNLLTLWAHAGTQKAAILNVGTSHQDRIVRKLPPDVCFIQLDTSATQS